LEEHQGRTLQSLLHDLGGLSHSRARGLIEAGAVQVNGRAVRRPDHRLEPGDRVEATHDPARRYRPSPRRTREHGWRTLHEDDDLVVVDKEPGLLTVPTTSQKEESLVERLGAAYRARGFRRSEVRVVHRIDRYTSGIVAFARNARAWSELRRQFAAGAPERVYLAVAEGVVASDRGRLVHHLHEDPASLRVTVGPPRRGVRPAACTFRVLERFEHATLLEVRLETGRRNQIRVQFASEGHPLVGDHAYGRPSERIPRTALHAHRLSIRHPSDGGILRFECPPPADFAKLLRSLRRGDRP
jgi:23S rRNA pseudouridine1911/1915/1917 synthase